jgi:hypothetical protein
LAIVVALFFIVLCAHTNYAMALNKKKNAGLREISIKIGAPMG